MLLTSRSGSCIRRPRYIQATEPNNQSSSKQFREIVWVHATLICWVCDSSGSGGTISGCLWYLVCIWAGITIATTATIASASGFCGTYMPCYPRPIAFSLVQAQPTDHPVSQVAKFHAYAFWIKILSVLWWS